MTKQLKTIEILNPPKSSNTGGWILMDSGWLELKGQYHHNGIGVD